MIPFACEKIFAFDIDGTIAENSVIKDGVNELFNFLRKNNHKIVLVTKRTLNETQIIKKQITTEVDVISFGGNVISNFNNDVIWSCAETINLNCLNCSDLNSPIVLEGISKWSIPNQGSLPLAKMVLGLSDRQTVKWGSKFPIYRVILRGKIDFELCFKWFGNNILVEYWDSFPITEIRTIEDKALGLSNYLKILGKDQKQVIAIGNDFNDISMFRLANISLTFSSSPKKVKKASTLVLNNFQEVKEFLMKGRYHFGHFCKNK